MIAELASLGFPLLFCVAKRDRPPIARFQQLVTQSFRGRPLSQELLDASHLVLISGFMSNLVLDVREWCFLAVIFSLWLRAGLIGAFRHIMRNGHTSIVPDL